MAGNRRGRGEGSIEQLDDGRWKGWVSGGKDPDTGKRLRKAVYGKTKAEVLARIREFLAEAAKGVAFAADGSTLGQWLDRWLASRKGDIEPRSFEQLDQHVRLHLKPIAGELPLAKITPAAVADLYARLKLSDAMKAKVATTLRSALREASNLRLIPHNPADSVRKPKRRRSADDGFTVWDADQAARFVAAALGDRMEALYAVALDTGMRMGELFGLTWDDVDFAAGTVRVRRSLEEGKEGRRRKAPKTASSKRTLRLGPGALDALARHKDAIGGLYSPTGPVFPDTRGGTLRRYNFRRDNFLPMVARAGVPLIRFHDLRHTAATLWLTEGVPVKAVSARLGHSNAYQTLKTYAHALPDSDDRIIAFNARLFAVPSSRPPFAGSVPNWQPDGNQSEAA